MNNLLNILKNMSNDALGTTIITILIFILGYVFSFIGKYVHKFFSNMRRRYEFIDMIKDISLKSKIISEGSLNVMNFYKNNNSLNITKCNISEANTIKEVGFLEIKKSFNVFILQPKKKNLKSKAFKMFYNYIDDIIIEQKLYESSIYRFQSEMGRLNNEIDICNQKLDNNIVSVINLICNHYNIIDVNDVNKVSNSYYREIITLYNNRNIEKFESFVNSLYDLNVNNANMTHIVGLNGLNNIQSTIIRSRRLYRDLKSNEVNFKNDYTHYYFFFRRVHFTFNKIINILK